MSDTTAQASDEDAPAAEHVYVDRSRIDFDPDEGLYTGTAVTGTTDIPGPHVDEDGQLADSASGEQDSQRGD